MSSLGDPHLKYPVVHVAGTSGKGSVCTFVAGICSAAGLKTGSHLTPYLQSPLEKLIVDDELAAMEEFVGLVDWFKSREASRSAGGWASEASYGAMWVALTCEYFRRRRVDIAIMEAGAGGLYDLTNVVEPLIAAVTSVGMDHVLSLGPTLADIARHKAGVFKAGIPAVAVDRGDDTLPMLKLRAEAVGAPFRAIRRERDYWSEALAGSRERLSYVGPNLEIMGAELGLVGPHQVDNAALAVAIADSLVDAGYPITQQSVEVGLAGARLPGRWEIVSDSPRIVLDGAHNTDKAMALAALLRTQNRRPLTLVMGMLGYKAVRGIVEALGPLADSVVATEPTVYMKAALSAPELAQMIESIGVEVSVRPDPVEALDLAVNSSGCDGLVCVTGSLYLVGQARERWYSQSAIALERTPYPNGGGATSD